MLVQGIAVPVPLEEMERRHAVEVPTIEVVALATGFLARAHDHPREQLVELVLLLGDRSERREHDHGVVIHEQHLSYLEFGAAELEGLEASSWTVVP
jgi:hypothetical protein